METFGLEDGKEPEIAGGSVAGEMAVVMITRGRPELAATTVDRLLRLPDRPQVVVVDQGEEPLVLASHERLLVLRPGSNLGAAGRNVGVAATEAEFVAFCDDDSWWEPGALTVASRLLAQHPRTALLAATVVVEPAGIADPFCELLASSPLPGGDGPGPRILGFMACAAVVRRSVFLAVGGFPSGFGVGGEEDRLALDLAAAGWELRYVSSLVAHHCPAPRSDHTARNRRLARNALWTSWQRFPAMMAARDTASVLRGAARRKGSLAGLFDAVAGWRVALRERRVVPDSVAQDRRLLLVPGAKG